MLGYDDVKGCFANRWISPSGKVPFGRVYCQRVHPVQFCSLLDFFGCNACNLSEQLVYCTVYLLEHFKDLGGRL